MHIREIHISNVKSIRDLFWRIPNDRAKGWHVVLGDNGSGKSTLLRSIAVALLGPRESYGLRQPWDTWLRDGCQSGRIELKIGWNRDFDEFDGRGPLPAADASITPGIKLQRASAEDEGTTLEAIDNWLGVRLRPENNVWSSKRGWFAASYGPFRRFTGDSGRAEQSTSGTLRRLNRHLSLFGEGVALTEGLDWLVGLSLDRQMNKDLGGGLLDQLRRFINQPDFLPAGVQLSEITSKQVIFSDASGIRVPVQELSDGYRSILSMTFELIRQLAFAFGSWKVFDSKDGTKVSAGGVVLIDEVDAHLHPTWQKRIGFWLCEHFPNIQFIVSTHSPLICQAAEHGSILLLPRSGSDDKARLLAGTDFKRIVYGNVLDAYGTEAFGAETAGTRSSASQGMRDRLAELNTRELIKGLSESERQEQAELRAALPTTAASLE